ncbi:DNRLRE domain-containing protein [Streptomyces megasporus]|uniref:DNRLRE domain-containing protein n=1 Tax=Streptomyces megasporus TaxID=44060 RepID=UPI000A566C19|nr:DNRLRE domain-containing protein [Streptomyces megasporus]
MSDMRFRRPVRHRPRGRAALAALLIGASLGFLPSVPTQASQGGTTDSSDSVSAEEQALDQAARSGKAKEVTVLRTENSEVHAQPDGTLRLTQHAQPVRVRRDGDWVPVDTTLTETDGRIAPKAATGGVTFSAGGEGALVKMADQGRSLALTWPEPLPEPVLEGSVARYPDVLPGVDLALAADIDGFSQALIVKTPQAARSAKLREVSFGLKVDGLTVRADEETGALTAKNPAGQTVFATSTARMWDSSAEKAAKEGPAAFNAFKRYGLLSSEPAADLSATTGDGLGPGARSAEVGLKVSDRALSLTPDQELLTSPDTVFPIYIDPRFTGSLEAWTTAYKPYPNTSYWNGAGWGTAGKYARVGYESEDGGTARSFFRLGSRDLADVQVLDAQFKITMTHSWSCSPRPVELWLTGGISSATTWNNQPAWKTRLDTLNAAHGNEARGCADKSVDFDATAAAREAASKKWSHITFGLRASSETDTFGWKRFAPNPTLIVDYNRRPKAPWNLDTSPSTHNGVDCGHTAPKVWLGNTDVRLTAYASDPDGGDVRVQFHLWATGKRHEAPGLLFVGMVRVSSRSTGTYAHVTIPKELLARHVDAAGGSFSWKAKALDDHSSSAWMPAGTAECRFGFDPQRPTELPTVSSVEYPDGTDGTQGAPARTPGTFTLGSGGISDVVEYRYGLDQYPPTSSAKPATAGGSVDITLTPTSTGPHTLYVQSVDHAGNVSDTLRYTFYATSRGITDEPGDLNGDGNPDFYAIDGSGNLLLYPGDGSGGHAPGVDVSTTGDWTGSLITQRGDWTSDGYFDLVARRTDGRLWLYPNDGLGHISDETRQEILQFTNEEDSQYIDPAAIDQLVAVGDLSHDTEQSTTDFLAVIGDRLWYLPGYENGFLDLPYLIGDSGWADTTLVSPGDLDGDGHPDLLVRDRTTGELWLHRGRPDAADATLTDPVSLGDRGGRVLYGTGWSPADRPLITASGDADGDGITDLWSTDASGRLLHLPGGRDAAGAPRVVGSSGWQAITALSS